MSDPFASAAVSAPARGTFRVTPQAAGRVCYLLEQEKNKTQALRVAVSSGGCSGFQCSFSFAQPEEEDFVFQEKGITVVIDPHSMTLLDGAELDFCDEMVGAFFRVNNPRAQASCGCGTSFSL